MLTTTEVAKRLGYSRTIVIRMIRAGKLAAYQMPGGHYRISEEQYASFIAGLELAAQQEPADVD